jgi:hypothetical protein
MGAWEAEMGESWVQTIPENEVSETLYQRKSQLWWFTPVFPSMQAQNPEFKPQYLQKKRRKKLQL